MASGISCPIPTRRACERSRRRKSAAITCTRKARRRPTHRTCSRSARGMRCRLRGTTRCWVDGRSRRSSTSAAVCRSRQPSRGTWPTTALADSGRIGPGSGTLASPTIDLWFDKTAFVVARPVHVRQFRRRHPAGGPSMECRRVALQAVRSPAAGGSSRAEAFNLLNSVYSPREHRHRHSGRWAGDQHVEPGTADPAGVKHTF